MSQDLITPGKMDNRSIEDVRPDELFGYHRVHMFEGIGVLEFALRAYYTPALDTVFMPPQEQFIGSDTGTATEAYYSTLAHETVGHWTGAKGRLKREFGKHFGDQQYAAEELVAELSAAFMCAQRGINNEPRQDHAEYLKNWITLMKADSSAIFVAASKASQAVRYTDNLQPGKPLPSRSDPTSPAPTPQVVRPPRQHP